MAGEKPINCRNGQHDMKYVGDLVFMCKNCPQTEIGCGHGRPKTKDGVTVCLICHEILEKDIKGPSGRITLGGPATFFLAIMALALPVKKT